MSDNTVPSLSQEFLNMHLHMVRMGRWKMIDMAPRVVRWGMWGAWGPCGFQRAKYEAVKKHYLDEPEVAKCVARMSKHAKDREWNSIALPMGVGFDQRPRSPLRYRDGQCMCGVVFRMDSANKTIYPQATWRVVEITRRFLVDCAVLDFLFGRILGAMTDATKTDWCLGEVALNLNVMWLSDYHAPLAEVWMPGLSMQGPSKRISYFQVSQHTTKFRSRQIGNDLAKKAVPMFDMRRRELLPTFRVDDFPKG